MTKQKTGLKIAIIGDAMSGGGAERVHSILSFFFESHGIKVYNCIFCDLVSYPYAGSLLNLGRINPDSISIIRKYKRFCAFKKFMHSHKFDYVIDFKMRDRYLFDFITAHFIYPKEAIYTVHNGYLDYYFPKSTLLSNSIYRNKSIVVPSKKIDIEIATKKKLPKTDLIYYPIDIEYILRKKDLFNINVKNYVIAVGRYHEIKQFDKLILAYSKSVLPKQSISLIIMGQGDQNSVYETLIKDLNLEKLVILKSFQENPFPYYKNAFFTVLSSKNEGFPNVLLESLACGTPVVSFDCLSGPSEIITNEYNGLLVEDQNVEKLTQAINLFVTDEVLYNHCKQNAQKSIEKFDIENIGNQWLEYLKINVS